MCNFTIAIFRAHVCTFSFALKGTCILSRWVMNIFICDTQLVIREYLFVFERWLAVPCRCNQMFPSSYRHEFPPLNFITNFQYNIFPFSLWCTILSLSKNHQTGLQVRKISVSSPISVSALLQMRTLTVLESCIMHLLFMHSLKNVACTDCKYTLYIPKYFYMHVNLHAMQMFGTCTGFKRI